MYTRVFEEADATAMMGRGASFSIGRKYRWRLERSWGYSAASVTWIMLNPSVADANVDDPTIKRCIRFSRRWGYERLTVVNLFAYRSTHPGILMTVPDPIGPNNDAMIDVAARMVALVVCAWGAGGLLYGRGPQVALRLREMGIVLHCLATTKRGQPVHPLRQRGALEPVVWS